ncbi:EF hand protein (macronuclear) [Tetrahymena thermophila SB210]|uniref:EF hand protein n=1 Tax=Tetrahymena thermophila (strain SB210) TaxID=312017 RepID=I7LVM7_TETTS|nr:EF hand protein [Tetrahymena thermophila SB210]EAR99366.3 EF hand protein [Tetrahymena thermophila SB210]|eukprot:XP_001019611.3 EF hand protein [Tetrahymena thermophila SB210]
MNTFTFGKGKQTELKINIKSNAVNSTGNIEYIEQVEKCQQIIRDDKNILRQLIKEGNSQVMSIIKSKKKFIDQMQTELKKFLKTYKNQQQQNEGEQTQTHKQQNQNDSFNSQVISERQMSRNSTHQNLNQNNGIQNKVQHNNANNNSTTNNMNNQKAQETQISQSYQHQQQVYTTTTNIGNSNKVNLITYRLNAPTPINQSKVVSLISKDQSSPLDKKPRSLSQQEAHTENKLSAKPQLQNQGVSMTDSGFININSARVQKNNYYFKNEDQNSKQPVSLTSRNDSSQQAISPKEINLHNKLKKVPSIPKYANNLAVNQDNKQKKSPTPKHKSPINKQNVQSKDGKKITKKNNIDTSKDASKDNSQIHSQDKLQTPKDTVKQTPNKKENENIASSKLNANVFSFDLQTASQPQYQTNRQNLLSPQQFQTKVFSENSNKVFGIAAQDQSERKFSITSSLSNTERQFNNKNSENLLQLNQLSQNNNYSVNLVKLDQIIGNQNIDQQQNNNQLSYLQNKEDEVKRANKVSDYTIKNESTPYQQSPYLLDINSNSDAYTLNRIETIYLNSEHNQKNNSNQNYDYQQYDQLDEVKQDQNQKLSTQKSNENSYQKQNFVDQNFNLDTVESNNYNPNKSYDNKQAQRNFTPQNQKIASQDNRQYNQQIEEKMFTFESPSKFISHKESSNRKQSTDGNVIFQDEYFALQDTPTKQDQQNKSISASVQKTGNFSITQNSYFPQNQLTDAKSIDQISKQNSSQKYQSPFENKNISHLHDGGVSPVIPSHKSNNQINLVGQAYSYNGSEVKQGRSYSEKDSYGMSYNFLLQDPIKQSYKLENSLANMYSLKQPNQIDSKDDPIYNSNQNSAVKNYLESPQKTQAVQYDYFNNQNLNKTEPTDYTFQQSKTQQFSQQQQQQQKRTDQTETSILLTEINERVNNLLSPKSENSTQNQYFSFANKVGSQTQNVVSQYGLGSIQNSIQPTNTTTNNSYFNDYAHFSSSSTSKTPQNNYYQSGVSNLYGISQPPPIYTFEQQKQNNIDSSSIGNYSYRESLSQPITQRESTYTPSYLLQNTNAAESSQNAKQSNSLLTDWSTLNSKIENENKKLSYQYDINTRINSLKPFQFTSDKQSFPNTHQPDNQYSQSFCNIQQNDDQKNQKQYNSFVQQPLNLTYQLPEIQTSFTPTTSYQNQQQQNSSISSNKIQFNSSIQEILDRYIPKSTPAQTNQQSIQINYQQPQMNAYSSSFSYLEPSIQMKFEEDKIKKQSKQQDYCSVGSNFNEASNFKKNQVDDLVSKYINNKSIQQASDLSQRQSENYLDCIVSNRQNYQDNNNNNNNNETNKNCGLICGINSNDQKDKIFIENQQLNSNKNQNTNLNKLDSTLNQQNGRFYSFQDNDGNNTLYKQLTKQSEQQEIQIDSNSIQDLSNNVNSNQVLFEKNSQNLTFNALASKYEFNSIDDFEKFNRNINDESDQQTPNNAYQNQTSEKISVVNVASILSSHSIDHQQPYFYSFHSNSMLENPINIPLPKEDCEQIDDKYSQQQLLTPRRLLHLPTLKHHLSKFTCEQVLEQIFDNFSLSLQSLTKEYFTYKMQTLVKQYIPQIQSIIILNKEINALFELSDMNKDWYLDINELGSTLSQICKPSEEDLPIKQLYKKIDSQNRGKITQNDLLNFANSRGFDFISFTNLFKQLDAGKKGFVTYYDLLLNQKNKLIMSLL